MHEPRITLCWAFCEISWSWNWSSVPGRFSGKSSIEFIKPAFEFGLEATQHCCNVRVDRNRWEYYVYRYFFQSVCYAVMHSRDGWCEHPTVVSKVLLVEMKRIFLVKILLVVLLELSADCCSSKHTSKRISAMNVVKFVKTIYLCLFCAHFKQKSTPFFLRILSHFTQRPEKVVVNSFWTKTAATVKCLRGNSNCKGRERPRMLNLRNRSTASLQADPDRGIGRTEASAPLQRSPRGKRTWDRTRQIRRREKHKKLENRGRNRKLRYPYSL